MRALIDAAREGDMAKVRARLDAGDDIEFRSKQTGRTPLIEAVIAGHLEVARLLVERKASLAARCKAVGFTPLAWAAEEQHEEIAELLLDAGADPNAASEEFLITPLMVAAGNGSLGIVKRLLARGADANAASADGRRALTFAKKNKHDAVAAVIEAAGGTAASALPAVATIPWPPEEKCDYTKPESVLRSFMTAMNRAEKRAAKRGMNDTTIKELRTVMSAYCAHADDSPSFRDPPEYGLEIQRLIEVKVRAKRAELVTRNDEEGNEFLYVLVKRGARWLIDAKKRRAIGTKWYAAFL